MSVDHNTLYTSSRLVYTSDVNDAEPRLSFSEKKTSPSRLILWVTETETASCFTFEHHLHH